VQSCDKVGEAVINIDVNSDLRNIVDKKGTGPNQPEQILLDYYVRISAINHRQRGSSETWMFSSPINRELSDH